MFLTPKDIHDKTFKRSFKGYDENEVDEFLDLIIKELNMMIDENERLRQELAARPVSQEYGSASLNEIVRLENMLKQVLETMPKGGVAPYPATDGQEKSNAAARKEEAEALAAEQRSKIEAFKKALDESRHNFEQLIEEQKKILNEKYTEILNGLSAFAGKPEPEEPPGPADTAIPEEAPAASFTMPEQPAAQPAKPEQQKPQFLARPMTPPQEAAPAQAVPAMPEQPPAVPKPQPVMQEQPTVMRQPQEAPPVQPAYEPRQQFMQKPVQPDSAVQEQPYAAPNPPPAEPERGAGYAINKGFGEQPSAQADNRFRPNYAEYEWLYKEKDLNDYNTETGANFDITFRNPREKEELKRLIDEVID